MSLHLPDLPKEKVGQNRQCAVFSGALALGLEELISAASNRGSVSACLPKNDSVGTQSTLKFWFLILAGSRDQDLEADRLGHETQMAPGCARFHSISMRNDLETAHG